MTRWELSQRLAESTLDRLHMQDIDMPDETWTQLVQDCDKNNDGFIQFAEFKFHLTK